MILPAQTIRALCGPCRGRLEPMISPFCERTVHNGVTHGLGPAGYDLRIAEDITLFPGSAVLVDAIEQFNMPLDVMGVLYTKSTWARQHIEIANTVIDPGWRGHLRLEISMHYGYKQVTIPAGTGVAHLVLMRLEEPTEQGYEGRYQDQRPNQNAIFDG